MVSVHEGQCGLCAHFGEVHHDAQKLVQIRASRKAPSDMIDECDHPKLSALHLKVTPTSGCDGFTPAAKPN